MGEPTPVSFDAARAVLAAQPFSQLIGATLTEFGAGLATIEIDIHEQHRQQYGVVHGGVWAYAADNAITFAAGSVLGASVLTAGFAIEYVRSARYGLVRAKARVEHADQRQAVCVADLERVLPDGTVALCAVAQGRVLLSRGGGGGAA